MTTTTTGLDKAEKRTLTEVLSEVGAHIESVSATDDGVFTVCWSIPSVFLYRLFGMASQYYNNESETEYTLAAYAALVDFCEQNQSKRDQYNISELKQVFPFNY